MERVNDDGNRVPASWHRQITGQLEPGEDGRGLVPARPGSGADGFLKA